MPICVIYDDITLGQRSGMFTTAELLRRLADRKVRNADIARTLGVSPSRVTEIQKGMRAIKLDEAVKLVAAFALEESPSPKVLPLPVPIARLVVRYVAAELCHAAPTELAVEEIAQDVRAFAEYVSDPQVRGSLAGAEAFFHAMKLRRLTLHEEGPRESDPDPA